MERNRIHRFLTALPGDEQVAPPVFSFVVVPPELWAELGESARVQLAKMYERAFLEADARQRRECVEQLLESIAMR